MLASQLRHPCAFGRIAPYLKGSATCPSDSWWSMATTSSTDQSATGLAAMAASAAADPQAT